MYVFMYLGYDPIMHIIYFELHSLELYSSLHNIILLMLSGKVYKRSKVESTLPQIYSLDAN